MSRGTFNLEFPHGPFAVIYVDENGQLQTKASASIAAHAWAIFTPDVTARFRERAFRHGQPNMTIPDNVFSSFDVSPTAGWRCPSSSMPTKLIPFEWEACRPSRKRMDTRRVGVGESQTRSALPVPSTAAEGMLCIKNREVLMEYYKKAFEVFQQTNCRLIAKSYIRSIEPRKQVNFPYNGRAKMARSSQRADPELTKPGWWPAGVPHRGPDHLLKEHRLRLLLHILCELKDSHDITAEKLRKASQVERRSVSPADKLQVLDEIYGVRQMEERYLDGYPDVDTFVPVRVDHLPESLLIQADTESEMASDSEADGQYDLE